MSTLRTNAVESITGTATDFPNSLKIQGTLVPSGSAATEPTSRFPYVVGSVSELASVPEGLLVDGAAFEVTETAAGHATYRWDESNNTPEDELTVIAAEGVTTGRFLAIDGADALFQLYRNRSMQDKLDESVLVTDFGTPTGVDDTQMFLDAFAVSDWVRVPYLNGQLYVLDNLEMQSGWRLTGVGGGRPHIRLPGRDWSNQIKVGILNYSEDVTDTLVEHLKLDGFAGNHQAQNLGNIEIMNCDGRRNIVAHCEIVNAESDGIDSDGETNTNPIQKNVFMFNEVHGCGGYGIHNSTFSHGNICLYNHVYNNGFTYNRGGIDSYFGNAEFQSLGHHTFIGNDVHDNHQNWDIAGDLSGPSIYSGNSDRGDVVVASSFGGIARDKIVSPYGIARDARSSGTSPGQLSATTWTRSGLNEFETDNGLGDQISLVAAGGDANSISVKGNRSGGFVTKVKLTASATVYNNTSNDIVYQIKVGNALRFDPSSPIRIKPGESKEATVETFRNVPPHGANFYIERWFKDLSGGTPTIPIGFPADSGEDEVYARLVVEKQ